MTNPLEGAADLTRKLHQLGAIGTGKIMRSVVRAGMKPAQKRARELIPQGSVPHRTYKGRLVGPGFASRNTRIVTRVVAGGQKASAALGLRREAFYGVQFVERRVGKSSEKGRAWLAPAFEQTQGAQLEETAKQLKKRIDKAAAGGLITE